MKNIKNKGKRESNDNRMKGKFSYYSDSKSLTLER